MIENIEHKSWIEKQALSEIKKESISNYLNFDVEYLILEYLDTKNNLLSSQKIDLSKKYTDEILFIVNKFNLIKENLEQIQIFPNWKIYIEYKKGWNRDKLVFDLDNKENIFLWDNEKAKHDKESLNIKSVKSLEKTDKILQAMDYIFTENDKEYFGELEDEDTLKTINFWKWLEWKNLKELQFIFKQNFEILKKEDINKLSSNIQKEYIKQEKKYLEMFMWVWNIYEGWAQYLEENKNDFENIIENIVDFSNSRQILNYLKEIHYKIDDNNYQSTSVEKSYKILSFEIHRKILEKFKKDNVKDEYFVKFSKIITWRWRHWLSSDIDDNLRDQETANDALLYMMNRKEWIIDRLKKSKKIKIENKEIENKNPKGIIDKLESKFYQKYWNDSKRINYFDNILTASWYGDILNISESKKYNDLTFDLQIKLWVLDKVLQKLKNSQNKSVEDFWNLFNEVAKDYNKQLIKDLENTFNENSIFDWSFWTWKDSKEMWLKWVEAEAFDLFQDIIWNWVFDLSDNSIENLKAWWKFIWVVAVAMTVPLILLPSLWTIAMWTAMWATASLASMAINPKWYDTVEEAVLDISTDIALWAATWAIWWAWASRYEWLGVKAFSKDFYKNQKVIMASDLVFLWLIPEAWRMYWIDYIYHSQEILENKTWQIK